MKDIFYKIFFSSNRVIGQPEAKDKEKFAQTFPDVYNVFKLLKRKNHTALAHLLQRIESEIIIQKVVKRIALEKPEFPIFTIHDSVATIKGNEQYVAAVMKEEIYNYTGLNAKEYWE